MKKKAIWIVIILLILALGFYGWNRYQKSQNEEYGTFFIPRLEYSAFVFKRIEPEVITMDMKMLIDNPTLFGFTVDSFTYDFYIADQMVFSSTYPEKIEFKGGDSSFIMLPVTMYNDSLTWVLDSLKKSGVENATYTVKGNFYADVPLLKERQFSYEQSFEAPLYKIPATKLKDWKYKKLENGDVTIDFILTIVNFNVFPYDFKDLSYEINLGNDKMVFDGAIMGDVNIPKEDSVDLVLPVNIDLDQLGGAAWNFIFKGRDLEYEFYSKLTITNESNTINDSPMELYSKGTLGTIIDLAKE